MANPASANMNAVRETMDGKIFFNYKKKELLNHWAIMASFFIFSSPGDIKASEYRIGHGVLVDMCPSL